MDNLPLLSMSLVLFGFVWFLSRTFRIRLLFPASNTLTGLWHSVECKQISLIVSKDLDSKTLGESRTCQTSGCRICPHRWLWILQGLRSGRDLSKLWPLPYGTVHQERFKKSCTLHGRDLLFLGEQLVGKFTGKVLGSYKCQHELICSKANCQVPTRQITAREWKCLY